MDFVLHVFTLNFVSRLGQHTLRWPRAAKHLEYIMEQEMKL